MTNGNKTSTQVPKTAKGHRPTFFKDPVNDRLMSMIMSLVTEFWVMRERLDTIEALANEKGLLLDTEIEAYEPDNERAEARERMRQEFLDRVLYIFQEEIENVQRGDTKEAYDNAVKISADG